MFESWLAEWMEKDPDHIVDELSLTSEELVDLLRDRLYEKCEREQEEESNNE